MTTLTIDEITYILHFSYPEEMPPFTFYMDNCTFRVEVDICRFKFDGKMQAIISRWGGAYCPQCDCTAESHIRRGEGYHNPCVSVM